MPSLMRSLLLRPHQWLKNGFVFVGLLFGHAWSDPVKLGQATGRLCRVLPAGLGRVCDERPDRPRAGPAASEEEASAAGGRHGRASSRRRRLAAVPAWSAAACRLALGRLGALDLLRLRALNVAYSFGLKHVVILDVFIIASGFMLRILAGTLGLGIAPSQWLLLCGLMLTLFLGFAKRRAELAALLTDSAGHRRVLEHYTAPMLDQFIGIAAAGTVISYACTRSAPRPWPCTARAA
jgi:hypothetical protein